MRNRYPTQNSFHLIYVCFNSITVAKAREILIDSARYLPEKPLLDVVEDGNTNDDALHRCVCPFFVFV